MMLPDAGTIFLRHPASDICSFREVKECQKGNKSWMLQPLSLRKRAFMPQQWKDRRQSSIGKSTVYEYFSSKDHIFQETLKEGLRAIWMP